MKGRYAGCRMTIYGSVLPGAVSIARSAFLAGNLSERAKHRLKMMDWNREHGNNLSLTARHFDASRRLLKDWRERLRKEGLRGLEDRSRRPHHLRQPTISSDTIAVVVALRKKRPAWSKYKIQSLLPDNLKTSVSSVGRILKRRGLINSKVSRKKSRAAKHPRARFPHGMKISRPGDMVQMDIKHIMLPGGRRHYQFTAIDVLTKQRVLERYSSEASHWGSKFLEACREELPFPIHAVQTDNGGTFQKEFRKTCAQYGISHYFIYPRSPKQNSYVEIAHGADEREFYEQGNAFIDPERMRVALKEWQRVWNEERPHQALNYLTPKQYHEKWQHGRLPTKDIITLQT